MVENIDRMLMGKGILDPHQPASDNCRELNGLLINKTVSPLKGTRTSTRIPKMVHENTKALYSNLKARSSGFTTT